ncbi:mucin-2-like [Littorina saxatilis]|uniref:mucin-2-like n=1 Tax=Littorina saxatilis TaxID=31220 RepID=UPI0038B4F916
MLKDPLQDKDSQVFVSENGSPIRSKLMSTIIKDILGGVNATMFRKLVTSEFADASEASRHNLAELAGHTTATQDSYYTPGRTSNQRCQAMLEVADKVTGGQEEPRPTTRTTGRRPTATITRPPLTPPAPTCTSGPSPTSPAPDSPTSPPSVSPTSPPSASPTSPPPSTLTTSPPPASPTFPPPASPAPESQPDLDFPLCATVPLSAADVATFGASWFKHNTKRLPESEVPKETQHRRGLRWSPEDHEVLFKYFGCWRGKENVVGLTCRQIGQVITHFGVKFSKTFSLQQIREKLKGWNPKKL